MPLAALGPRPSTIATTTGQQHSQPQYQESRRQNQINQLQFPEMGQPMVPAAQPYYEDPGYQQQRQGYYPPEQRQQQGYRGGLATEDFDRRRPIDHDSYGGSGGSTIGYADTKVQGFSRRTWSSSSSSSSSSSGGGMHHGHLITMETEGRPLQGQVEIWEGPNNTPLRFRVYSEDGRARPFQALVEPSPQQRGTSQTVSVRNAGPLEFPMSAGVQKTMPTVPYIPGSVMAQEEEKAALPHPGGGGMIPSGRYSPPQNYYSNGAPGNYMAKVERGSYMQTDRLDTVRGIHASSHPDARTVTIDGGGALKTVSVNRQMPKIKIRIHSQGLPVRALLEVWEGPGQSRQVAEIESQDGLNRPFACAIDTYGHGATICVRNLGDTTFPILLTVEPFY